MHTQILLCLFFSALSLKMGFGVGVGESSLGEGLVRNNVLIELGVAKLFPVCLSLGWAFVFKCALGNKTELECECFCVLFAIQKPTGHLVD